jgi:membrane-bound lytic murein transglycosylase B
MLLLNMFIYKYILLVFFILNFLICHVFSEDNNYNLWLYELEKDAIKRGISINTFKKAMKNVVILPKVKKLDKKQPEKTITFEDYYKRTVNNLRIKIGKKKYELHKKELIEIADIYRVQPRFILAIWGIETNYGNYTGDFSVISSLATLSYNGRRSNFFRSQLLDAIKIIDDGHIELENMIGSWAGAMGQSQFMPSSFLTYAQDYDNDGKKDIWTNELDVFASIANYLKVHGWDYTKTWGREVLVPKKIINLYKDKFTKAHSLKFWSDNNVTNINGGKLPYINYKSKLIFPDGLNGRAFLVYNNFYKTKKYNASTYYALSIGLLADRIKF